MQKLSTNIIKLYVSNFLTGLVFWYGIEKLFMQSIGLGALDIGWLMGIQLTMMILLDIPAGILADRWSRKGTLIVAIAFLALASVIAATSTSGAQYLLAYLCYAAYAVMTSGTYHAIIYDVLHEDGKANKYSKIMGTAYALFLCGAGVANISSGFLGSISLSLPFWLTVIPCTVNIVVLLSIKEPRFHKTEQRGNFIAQLGAASKAIWKNLLLRSLVIAYAGFAASELFKQDFSQLYMLDFFNDAILLGLFWAGYAFAWALGSYLAHRFPAQLTPLLVISMGSFAVLSVLHTPWALVIFTLQAVTAAMAQNLIETRIQDATPSAVRASIMSVLATINRGICVPVSFILGWLIASFDIFAALMFSGTLCVIALTYWLLFGARRLKAQPTTADIPAEEYVQI